MSKIQDIVTTAKSEKSVKAKQTLVDFVKIIDPKLVNYFDRGLKKPFGISTKEKILTKHVLNHIKEHNLRPAKRLRASFAYYSYKMLGGKNESVAYDAAMSVELVHTALLMHDDFMDQDDTRRGKPTTHEYYKSFHQENYYRFDSRHYGESMAVNAGDTILCLGFQILADTKADPDKKTEALSRFLQGIANTAYGQIFDITLEANGKAKESDIINLHHAKTAIYTYENPLHIGAILAGASKSDLALISKYAIPGGIAFQLQDDILGLFGDIKKTGKPAHSDLRQGKMTLLIIKALENGSKNQVKRLKEIWGNRNLSEEGAEEARRIVIDSGSLDYSNKISVKWAKKAQEAIPLMKGRRWNKTSIDYLDGIAQYMIERDL